MFAMQMAAALAASMMDAGGAAPAGGGGDAAGGGAYDAMVSPPPTRGPGCSARPLLFLLNYSSPLALCEQMMQETSSAAALEVRPHCRLIRHFPWFVRPLATARRADAPGPSLPAGAREHQGDRARRATRIAVSSLGIRQLLAIYGYFLTDCGRECRDECRALYEAKK